jgi:DNA-binding IclR family transcriptional regulator
VSEFNETAVLAVRDEDDAVALEQIVARQRVVNVHYRPGTRHPLSVGAHGLAMLADVHRPPQDYDRALLPRLAEIARIGYAVSHDELEPGVTGVAAPIVSATGRPIAAVGVVAPTIRFPRIPDVAESVITAARTISHHLAREEPYEPTRATRPIHLPKQAAH